MSDLERKARELLSYECPECGGENGHESEEGWLRCSRCSNPHEVTRHQAMQAIIGALTPLEGYVLVPVEPTEAMIEALNCKDSLPYPEPNRIAYKARHCYSAMLAARPEVK